MYKNYPSHVTKEQFENIKLILENVKKKIKPGRINITDRFSNFKQ
ncbi:hypothetical protein [Spiroplasma endosymbiont of Notiophilus biguttatus]